MRKLRIGNRVFPFGVRPEYTVSVCCCVHDKICITLTGWSYRRCNSFGINGNCINFINDPINDITIELRRYASNVNGRCDDFYVSECVSWFASPPVFLQNVARPTVQKITLGLSSTVITTMPCSTSYILPSEDCGFLFNVEVVDQANCVNYVPGGWPSRGSFYTSVVARSLFNGRCEEEFVDISSVDICTQNGLSPGLPGRLIPGQMRISWGSQAVCSGYGYGYDTSTPIVSLRMASPPQLAEDVPEPVSAQAVVTVAVGRKGHETLAVSRPAMEAAAARWGADFHVVEGDETEFNVGEKMRIKPLVEQYERTLFLDADIIVSPDAPSPFEEFPPGSVYAHDDLPLLFAKGHGNAWLEPEAKEVVESQGEIHETFRRYWNSGFWLVDREHAEMFRPPTQPYKSHHCAEQHWVNHVLGQLGYPVVEIGRKWNWQWWIDPDMQHTEGVHILHFAGMANTGTPEERHQARLHLMRQYAGVPEPRTAFCTHIGKRLTHSCCPRNDFHECDIAATDSRVALLLVDGHAIPSKHCQTCEAYEV
jgi:hypothetical protein